MNFDEYVKFEKKLILEPAPRPNRVHIGLVQLANDHSLETDWSHLIGTQASLFSTRVYKENGMSKKSLDGIAAGINEAALLVADGLPMDVMAFACTSASIIIGEEKVSQLLTKNRSNIPTTNPWTAAKASFNYLRAKKIAVFSPYPSDVNYALHQQLSEEGFEVVAITSLGVFDDNDLHKASLKNFETGLAYLTKNTGAEVVFMSCTSLRAVENIQYLEEKYGVPIVSSNSALFWHAMHLSGKRAKCPGYGKLLNI